MASTMTKMAQQASKQINAVVVSAGLMQKTVKVRVGDQKWNNHIRKYFNRKAHLLVHDPRESLRVGDIVAITPGWRASKHVHHVVSSIIAPFGEPIEARPPVPTEEERVAEREARRLAKAERKRRRKSEEKSEGEASGEEGKEVKKDVEALNV